MVVSMNYVTAKLLLPKDVIQLEEQEDIVFEEPVIQGNLQNTNFFQTLQNYQEIIEQSILYQSSRPLQNFMNRLCEQKLF